MERRSALKGSSVLSKGFVVRIALSFLIAVFVYFIIPLLLRGGINFLGPLLLPVYFLSLIVNGYYTLVIAIAVFVLAFWLLGYYFE